MQILIGKRTLLAKSCLVCGKLKPGSSYAAVMKHYKQSYCHECHNLRSRPGMHAHQEGSLERALSHRQPWSDAELRYLAEMAAKGRTGPEMALELNRTVYSVYTMKAKLNKES